MAARRGLQTTISTCLRRNSCRISYNAVRCLSDKITHTGQQFDPEDWKKIRFIDKSKLVNENVAINMVAEEPPIEVDARVVWCNGGGGALGHPKVFINLDKPGVHDCGYCGLRYTKKPHH